MKIRDCLQEPYTTENMILGLDNPSEVDGL